MTSRCLPIIAVALIACAPPLVAQTQAHPAKPARPASAKAGLNKALGQAVLHGDAAKVETLLNQGASPNARVGGAAGTLTVDASVLLVAVRSGQTHIVQSLLDKGADISGKDDVMEPLMVAVHGHDAGIVRLLLEHGANPSTPSIGGLTALMDASGNGDTEIVRLLLAKKAIVSAHDEEGLTALKMATNNGHGNIVALLKAAGAKK